MEKRYLNITEVKELFSNNLLNKNVSTYGSINVNADGEVFCIKISVDGSSTIDTLLPKDTKAMFIRVINGELSMHYLTYNEMMGDTTVEISKILYDKLNRIGLIPSDVNEKNIGASDYAKKLIQPWVIFNDHSNLNYQECDIIKRILRTKAGESRLLDLEKIKHIVDELIRQEKLKKWLPNHLKTLIES